MKKEVKNDKKNTKKSTNNIIIICALITILIVGCILFYFITRKEDEFVIGETLKIDNASDYLVQYDDNDYYLIKANSDIKFSVTSKDKEIKYKIVDENDKEVATNVSKDKNNFIIASNKNYEAGKTYKITLENASFTDEKLKDIKTLYFTITRPNSNTQVLNDNVIKVSKDNIKGLDKDENYYTIYSNKEFKKDDILYYQNNNEVIALKINDVKKENNNYVMTTSAPTLEELFKELDIYGEFNLKLNDFIKNEELKDYIKVAIVENGLLDNIVPKVQAKDIIDIDINYQRDGSAKVLVSLNLEHGNKGILKNALEKHDMKLDIELIIRLKAHADITLFKQDIGASLDIDINTDFNINPVETKEFKFNYDKDVNDNLNVSVGLFKDLLNKTPNDSSKDDITIGKMIIPTPILGLSVDLEVDLVKELELLLKANVNVKNNFTILFGHNNKGFYKNFDFKVNDSSYDVLGKAEAKLGLNPKVNINFCRIMEAGIESPLGVYAKGQVNYMDSSAKEFDGNMEIGAFVSAGVYAETHFLIAKAEAKYEKEFPIIKIDAKIKDKCEEQILNGDYSCFVGIYKSINNETKEILKDGVNVPYNRMSDGKEEGRAKLKSINVKDGRYILNYDIGYFYGQAADTYIIVPVGVDYETVNDWCPKCDSNDKTCRYEKGEYEYELGKCYYTTDNTKVRLIETNRIGGPVIYYKD